VSGAGTGLIAKTADAGSRIAAIARSSTMPPATRNARHPVRAGVAFIGQERGRGSESLRSGKFSRS
jgi:hypothetical protein